MLIQYGLKAQQQSISAGKNKTWTVDLPTSYKFFYSVSFGVFGNSAQPICIYGDSVDKYPDKTISGFIFHIANRNSNDSAILFGAWWITIGY